MSKQVALIVLLALAILAIRWCDSPPGSLHTMDWSFVTSTTGQSTAQGWHRLTTEPIPVLSELSGFCRPVTPDEMSAARTKNIHGDAFLHIVVNDAGRRGFETIGASPFPEGAIILKFKYPIAGDALETGRAELVTAMIKQRERVYPSSRDWEFVSLSGDLRRTYGRGSLATCLSCHQQYTQTDFVSTDWSRKDAPGFRASHETSTAP